MQDEFIFFVDANELLPSVVYVDTLRLLHRLQFVWVVSVHDFFQIFDHTLVAAVDVSAQVFLHFPLLQVVCNVVHTHSDGLAVINLGAAFPGFDFPQLLFMYPTVPFCFNCF